MRLIICQLWQQKSKGWTLLTRRPKQLDKIQIQFHPPPTLITSKRSPFHPSKIQFSHRILYSFIIFHIQTHVVCVYGEYCRAHKFRLSGFHGNLIFHDGALPIKDDGENFLSPFPIPFMSLPPFSFITYITICSSCSYCCPSSFPSLATACWDFPTLKRNKALSACRCFNSSFVKKKTTKFHTRGIPFPF